MLKKTDLVTELNSKILAIPGVVTKNSRYGDRKAYYVDVREFAHFHGSNEIDVRLTKKYQRIYRDLLHDDRVVFRKNSSDWIVVGFHAAEDLNFVFKLLELAWEANRAEVVRR